MFPRRMTSQAATLGRSDVTVPRLGVGAMTWGDPSGRAAGPRPSWPTVAAPRAARRSSAPSRRASPPARPSSTRPRCTAPGRLAGSASWLADGTSSSRRSSRRPCCPERTPCHAALERSLELLGRTSVELYMHHYPSRWVSTPKLMDRMADAVAGQGAGGRRQRLLGRPDAPRPPCPRGPRRPARLEPGRVLAPPSTAGDRRRPRRMSRSGGDPHRQPAARQRGADRQIHERTATKQLPALHAPLPRNAAGGHRSGRRLAAGGIGAELRPERSPGRAALAHRERARPAHPGCKNERQAADNAGALSFSLTPTEIEALDRATAAWRGTKGTTS